MRERAQQCAEGGIGRDKVWSWGQGRGVSLRVVWSLIRRCPRDRRQLMVCWEIGAPLSIRSIVLSFSFKTWVARSVKGRE